MPNRKTGKYIGIAAVVLAAVVLVAVGWIYHRGAIMSWVAERIYKQPVPSAQPARDFVAPTGLPVSGTATPLPASPQPTGASLSDLPNEINLAVPFAPQAPFGNWEQPYQDACEEATIIMVERYLRGASLSLAEMDAEILRMVGFQTNKYGFFEDSNVAETVRLAQEFYPHLRAEARYDVGADDIRVALTRGQAVVVLVNGQRLGNPFYTSPGPDKHTLVIKGMVGDTFITNDPGTKRGADFVYPAQTVLGAMVDYDGDTPGTGKKAMILISSK